MKSNESRCNSYKLVDASHPDYKSQNCDAKPLLYRLKPGRASGQIQQQPVTRISIPKQVDCSRASLSGYLPVGLPQRMEPDLAVSFPSTHVATCQVAKRLGLRGTILDDRDFDDDPLSTEIINVIKNILEDAPYGDIGRLTEQTSSRGYFDTRIKRFLSRRGEEIWSHGDVPTPKWLYSPGDVAE